MIDVSGEGRATLCPNRLILRVRANIRRSEGAWFHQQEQSVQYAIEQGVIAACSFPCLKMSRCIKLNEDRRRKVEILGNCHVPSRESKLRDGW